MSTFHVGSDYTSMQTCANQQTYGHLACKQSAQRLMYVER